MRLDIETHTPQQCDGQLQIMTSTRQILVCKKHFRTKGSVVLSLSYLVWNTAVAGDAIGSR